VNIFENPTNAVESIAAMTFALNPLVSAPPPPAPPAPSSFGQFAGAFASVSNNGGSKDVRNAETKGKTGKVEVGLDSGTDSGGSSSKAYGDSTYSGPEPVPAPVPEPEPEPVGILAQFFPQQKQNTEVDVTAFGNNFLAGNP
jgi:hypothetical protein